MLLERKNEQILGIDFEFIINEEYAEQINSAPILIKTGDFKDVVYHYSNVKLEKEATDGSGILEFGYSILKGDEEQLITNLDFQTNIGDILLSMIMASTEETEDNNFDTKNRTFDIKRSDDE
jgi:hypothetical protein